MTGKFKPGDWVEYTTSDGPAVGVIVEVEGEPCGPETYPVADPDEIDNPSFVGVFLGADDLKPMLPS